MQNPKKSEGRKYFFTALHMSTEYLKEGWQVDWFLMLCKSELFISLHAVIFLGCLENGNPGLHEKKTDLNDPEGIWGKLKAEPSLFFTFQ